MTTEQFTKYRFRHSEVIIYHQKHPELDVECVLVGIDFDGEMLQIVPLDMICYEDKAFWANIKYCDKERAIMRIVKK